jgi:hypothetical protein
VPQPETAIVEDADPKTTATLGDEGTSKLDTSYDWSTANGAQEAKTQCSEKGNDTTQRERVDEKKEDMQKSWNRSGKERGAHAAAPCKNEAAGPQRERGTSQKKKKRTHRTKKERREKEDEYQTEPRVKAGEPHSHTVSEKKKKRGKRAHNMKKQRGHQKHSRQTNTLE